MSSGYWEHAYSVSSNLEQEPKIGAVAELVEHCTVGDYAQLRRQHLYARASFIGLWRRLCQPLDW